MRVFLLHIDPYSMTPQILGTPILQWRERRMLTRPVVFLEDLR